MSSKKDNDGAMHHRDRRPKGRLGDDAKSQQIARLDQQAKELREEIVKLYAERESAKFGPDSRRDIGAAEQKRKANDPRDKPGKVRRPAPAILSARVFKDDGEG